jgi:hypothetical protein
MVVNYVNKAIDYVTIEEVKQHLRILDADEDVFIKSLIDAAFDIASDYVGFSIRKATAEYWFDNDCSTLKVPSRVLSISSVQYVNSAGVLTSATYNTLGKSYGNYSMDVIITDVPSDFVTYGEKYKVLVTEGFELQSADVNDGFKFPDRIRSAVYMICANLYENRQDDVIGTSSSEIPMNSKYLLDPYKIMMFV